MPSCQFLALSEASPHTEIHGSLGLCGGWCSKLGFAHIGELSCQQAGGSSRTFLWGASLLKLAQLMGAQPCPLTYHLPLGALCPTMPSSPLFPALLRLWASSLPQPPRPARQLPPEPCLWDPSARLAAQDLPGPSSLCVLGLAFFSWLRSTFHRPRGCGSRGPWWPHVQKA